MREVVDNDCMTLSIIIPVYNEERYIKRCIDSILNQLQVCDEILIIDNNSKDNTLKICKSIQEKYKNVYVYSEPKQGVSAARNRGLDLAKGNYVMFVDGDDFLPLDILPYLRECIQNYPDKIIQGNIIAEKEYVDKKFQEQSMKVLRSGSYMQKVALYPSMYKDREKAWVINSVYGVFGKIFPRKTILNMRFYENIALGEDLLFYLQALNKSDTVVISENMHIVNSFNVESSTRRINPGLADSVELASDKLIEMYGGNAEMQENLYYQIFRHIEVGVLDQIKKMGRKKTLLEMTEYAKHYLEPRKDIYQKAYEVILKKKFSEGPKRSICYYLPITFLKNGKYNLYCKYVYIKERLKQYKDGFKKQVS